jgi:hypothetical protein
MYRLLTLSSALALSAAAPSFAQSTDPLASPPAPDAPITTEAPAPVEPVAEPAPVAEPSAPAVDAKTATVTQIIETEFPSYDADKSGELTQPEFTAWVLALHSKAEEAQAATKLDAAAKAKWAKDAFATADADKSKKISKAEMSSFLLG